MLGLGLQPGAASPESCAGVFFTPLTALCGQCSSSSLPFYLVTGVDTGYPIFTSKGVRDWVSGLSFLPYPQPWSSMASVRFDPLEPPFLGLWFHCQEAVVIALLL